MVSSKERQKRWKLLFDTIAPTYEREYSEHPFWILYNEITWSNIKKYLPESKKHPILDAGGGTGFWSRKLAELDYRVVCADISEGMLNEGKRMIEGTPLASKIDFVHADIINMAEFPDECFSLVLAEGDPLSYCDNPDKAVKEMVRVAKKGVYIIASVDSFFGALSRMVQARDFEGLNMLLESGDTSSTQGEIQHNFTVEELRNLYLQNGLEAVDIIAKPVFAMAIPWSRMEEILGDERYREKILELELRFNSDPRIVGLGNHLEIVGRKK